MENSKLPGVGCRERERERERERDRENMIFLSSHTLITIYLVN